MSRIPIYVAVVAVAAGLAAGCGDSDSSSEAPATAAQAESTPAQAAATATPDETATPAAKSGGCRTAGVVITVTGGQGLTCKQAKKIYKAYMSDAGAPKGWTCEVRACTNIEGEELLDFTWEAA